MFNGGIFLLFGAFVVPAIVVLGTPREEGREEFQAVCAQRGWTWVERDDRWVETFADQPFGLGHRRSATNVVTGAYDSRQSCPLTTATTRPRPAPTAKGTPPPAR
ncbi:MAG: hypothetical protein R2734_02295 [Nocardioides sp.]